MTDPQATQVVIVGAGFAGLQAALGLAGARGVQVTLIDRRNHHLFQPLLYQVATAALSPADIAAPIRSLVSRFKNIDVIMGEVTGVDPQAKEVRGDFGTLSFDYLALACGCDTNYFGHNEWERHAPSLKSIHEATDIRRRILHAFELADRETDPAKQRALLTFVVVGGGPTGVELAGSLGEISRYTLARDFRRIDPARARVLLVEGGPRVLPAFEPSLSARATRDLEALGVTVWTDARVSNITEAGVAVGDEFVAAQTVLWSAGIGPAKLNANTPFERDRAGRVVVGADLCVPGHDRIFVLGDQAHIPGPTAAGRGQGQGQGQDKPAAPLPGLAPVAIQCGRYFAKTVRSDLKGRQREPFRYRDKGIMATIGRNNAIAQAAGLKLKGRLAWLVWLFVHIMYLVGFKNRVVVLFQWGWSYLTLKRGARLITGVEGSTRREMPGYQPSEATSASGSAPAAESSEAGDAQQKTS